jgi:hypothetical protein
MERNQRGREVPVFQGNIVQGKKSDLFKYTYALKILSVSTIIYNSSSKKGLALHTCII